MAYSPREPVGPGLGVDGAVELAHLLMEAGYLRAAAEPGVEAARHRAA